MEVFWFVPTHGDGHYLGTSHRGRATDLHYMRQIVQAADRLGYSGVLLPTGKSCEDAWIVASSLISSTEHLKFLVAVRPGLVSPTLAARMAATFDRLSEGRLLINVVTGGDPVELAADGVHLSHDDRYALTDEFLSVWRDIMTKRKDVSQKGEYFDIENASLLYPSLQQPYPPLYFGGSSGAAINLAAKHVDVYLTWGEAPAAVAEKIESVKRSAVAQGRTLKFGIRLHVIVRETEREAWAAADDLISRLNEETIAKAQKVFERFDSEGQRRMTALHDGRRESLEISPNLWAGVGLVRGGAGTALVGDPKTVAARMQEYADMGVETFILSGYPHLEEAYQFAEMTFPLLPLSSDVAAKHEASFMGPFGETLANDIRPSEVREGELVRAGSK